MLRQISLVLTCALAVGACDAGAPEPTEQAAEEVIISRVPRRQLKIQRMVDGPEFQEYRVRHSLRAAHYDGLLTRDDLSTQVLFQLYRGERLRALDEKEDKAEARAATRRGGLASTARRGFLPQARSARRQFYGTPWFARLEAQRAVAVADIGAALRRPQVPRGERVELLRILHALVKDQADPAATRVAKAAFLSYALRSFDPTVEDHTPHLAFAYYGRLESSDATRVSNGARFARARHAALPPHLARRMYTTDFERLRATSRVLGVSR